MNDKARPINGEGAETEVPTEDKGGVHAVAQEAADFLLAIKEGKIAPHQVIIAYYQIDRDGNPAFGMASSGGNIFEQQGLLSTAIAHLTSVALAGPHGGAKH